MKYRSEHEPTENCKTKTKLHLGLCSLRTLIGLKRFDESMKITFRLFLANMSKPMTLGLSELMLVFSKICVIARAIFKSFETITPKWKFIHSSKKSNSFSKQEAAEKAQCMKENSKANTLIKLVENCVSIFCKANT